MSLALWRNVWDEVIGCRQTRHFFPEGPRPSFYKSIIFLPKPIVNQLVQIITGHTFLKRHQAVIDESERQRCLEALDWDNADDNDDAIIDAADPRCSRCNDGDETPLHLLTECDRLADLRLSILGDHELVGPGDIPDFSGIPVYKLISFFREAKFETLSMLPFRDQYLPTNTGNEESDKSLIERKNEADKKGKEWLSKYLFRMPLVEKLPSKKTSDDSDSDTDNSQVDNNSITDGTLYQTHLN